MYWPYKIAEPIDQSLGEADSDGLRQLCITCNTPKKLRKQLWPTKLSIGFKMQQALQI